MIGFELVFDGGSSGDGVIDLYDISQALVGFQRSLALTAHLAINGKIITQAPSLSGARVITTPAQIGSYKVPAYIALIGSGIFSVGTADKETPIGHLIYSLYDYAVYRAIGVEVDYEESLRQTYDLSDDKSIEERFPKIEQMDSLLEKIEPAIREMHRPIVKSKSAASAVISFKSERKPSEIPFNEVSYRYLLQSERGEDPIEVIGKVSSYNVNTFKGRIFSYQERRPIPFQLEDVARSSRAISRITASLRANARRKDDDDAAITLIVFENRTPTGRLKSYSVMDVD